MIWQILACVLATAGLILFCWCLIGSFLLPVAGQTLSAVYRATGEAEDLEQTVRSFAWLRGTGMIDFPLQILDCGMSVAALQRARQLAQVHPYIQLIGIAAWEEQVEKQVGYTAGDDPRQRGCGGVSE